MMPIPETTSCQLGPESAAVLRLLDLRLLAAQQSLEGLNPAEVRGVNDSLADVDDLFAHLVGCWELDGAAAQRIECVRDALSSHLVAATALAQAGIPATGVLRCAVESTRTEVKAVLATPRNGHGDEVRVMPPG